MPIHKTAIVSPKAEVDPAATIGPNAIIEEGVKIGPRVRIMPNAYICTGTEIGEGTEVHMGAIIGHTPQDHAYKGEKTGVIIGKNNIIREYVTIHRATGEGKATVVGDRNMLMGQCHLGHNCIVGNDAIIANSALLAGYVQVEDGVFISGNVVFHQFCRIGRLAIIGGFTGVNKDVPPYLIVRGPSAVRGVNAVGLRRAGFSREKIDEAREAYRLLYLTDMKQEDALAQIEKNLKSPEIEYFVAFIRASKRGICKAKYEKGDYFDD